MPATAFGPRTAYHPNTLRLQSKTVTAGMTSGTPPNQVFNYGPSGFWESVNTGGGAINETYQYTSFDQLWRYQRSGSFSTVNSEFNYRSAGDLAQVRAGTNVDSYLFLGADKTQLTRRDTNAVRFEYTYDGAGRVDGHHRTTQAGTPIADIEYAYNSFNLPTSISNSSSMSWTFEYDAFGNRVKKTRGTTARALYVGEFYEERSTDEGIQESVYRIHGDEGVSGEVAKSWLQNQTSRRVFHLDHQRSLIAQTIDGVSTLTGGFNPFGGRSGPLPPPNPLQLRLRRPPLRIRPRPHRHGRPHLRPPAAPLLDARPGDRRLIRAWRDGAVHACSEQPCELRGSNGVSDA